MMHKLPRHWTLFPALLLAGGCNADRPSEPVLVSVIGKQARLIDTTRAMPDETVRSMMVATAQGLVTFDANGQIEPALAERWNIINDGQNYIFRIRQATWPDGRTVTSGEVAQILRTAIAARKRSEVGPALETVEAIVPMTEQVIEIRLSAPMPGLLQILAQPEFSISRNARGTGPYRVHSRRNGVLRLRLIPEPDENGELPGEAEQEKSDIRVRGEDAASAITRFVTGGSDLVSGGRFQDLPLVSATDPRGRFRVDPVSGLFGLRILNTQGPLGDRNVRIALSLAIDRQAALRLIQSGSWKQSIAILPQQLDSAAAPAALDLAQQSQSQRVDAARRLAGGHSGKSTALKIGMPTGPGSRLLLAAIARDWRKIGFTAQLAKPGERADLSLIDETAPAATAFWYLGVLGCQTGLPCSSEATDKLAEAARAQTPADRARLIGEADALYAASQLYIPLAQPLRWSLVDQDLTGWRDNAAGSHPFQYLRLNK